MRVMAYAIRGGSCDLNRDPTFASQLFFKWAFFSLFPLSVVRLSRFSSLLLCDSYFSSSLLIIFDWWKTHEFILDIYKNIKESSIRNFSAFIKSYSLYWNFVEWISRWRISVKKEIHCSYFFIKKLHFVIHALRMFIFFTNSRFFMIRWLTINLVSQIFNSNKKSGGID